MDKLAFEYWKSLILESKFGISFILFCIILFSFAIYHANVDIESTEELTGQLISMHQKQTKTGSKYSIFIVQLNNGTKVNVQPPPNIPFKKGKEIKITQIKKESGQLYYNYHSYAD